MRRPARLLLCGALVVAAACGGDDDDQAAPSSVRATTTSLRATTTTRVTTTPATTTTTTTMPTVAVSAAPPTPSPASTAPPLPTPVDPPLEDGTREATFEVGILDIPRIGLSARMWEGVRLSTLDRGPGHWPGSALPGALGNVVVAAHRTSHNAEFRHIDDLEPGDEVIMSTLGGRFVYHVVRSEVVTPDALWILDQTPARTATLFACHPPGSVRERIVVHLELVA